MHTTQHPILVDDYLLLMRLLGLLLLLLQL